MQPSPILNNPQSPVPEVHIQLSPAEAVVPEVLQDVAVAPAPQSSSLRDCIDLFTSSPLTQTAYALRWVRNAIPPAVGGWCHEASAVSLLFAGSVTSTAGAMVMAIEKETMPGLLILCCGAAAMLISLPCLAAVDNSGD